MTCKLYFLSPQPAMADIQSTWFTEVLKVSLYFFNCLFSVYYSNQQQKQIVNTKFFWKFDAQLSPCFKVVETYQPAFLAIHCQEVGGKKSENNKELVHKFVRYDLTWLDLMWLDLTYLIWCLTWLIWSYVWLDLDLTWLIWSDVWLDLFDLIFDLTWLIWSDVWFHLISFDSIWFHLISFDSIWFHLIPLDFIWFDFSWFHLISFDFT